MNGQQHIDDPDCGCVLCCLNAAYSPTQPQASPVSDDIFDAVHNGLQMRDSIDALTVELQRQREHNKLQQATLHELHARMKDKDAAIARLSAELKDAKSEAENGRVYFRELRAERDRADRYRKALEYARYCSTEDDVVQVTAAALAADDGTPEGGQGA